MFPEEHDGAWTISRGIPLNTSRGIVRVPPAYEAWNGVRWGLPSAAMKFPTREAAEEYMEENREWLES